MTHMLRKSASRIDVFRFCRRAALAGPKLDDYGWWASAAEVTGLDPVQHVHRRHKPKEIVGPDDDIVHEFLRLVPHAEEKLQSREDPLQPPPFVGAIKRLMRRDGLEQQEAVQRVADSYVRAGNLGKRHRFLKRLVDGMVKEQRAEEQRMEPMHQPAAGHGNWRR